MADDNRAAASLRRLQVLADQSPGTAQLQRRHAAMRHGAAASAGAPSSAPVIQRLVNVPFNDPDDILKTFLANNSAGMAEGDSQTGKYTKKVRTDEDIVLVGHGNGAALMDKENNHAESFSPDSLATYLAGILPKDYARTITVWSCQSATPYKHLKGYDKAEDKSGDLGDRSFIKILQEWLESKNIGFQGEIRGAIGFITMDRRYDRASVYQDEDKKMLGTLRLYPEGFVNTEETPDPSFYAPDSDEDDDEAYGADSVSSGSAEEDMVEDEPMQDWPATKTLRWLNIHSDLGGINVNAPPSHFAGETVVDILDEVDGNYQVKIVSTTNWQLAPSVGRQVWMKKAWLTKAL